MLFHVFCIYFRRNARFATEHFNKIADDAKSRLSGNLCYAQIRGFQTKKGAVTGGKQ